MPAAIPPDTRAVGTGDPPADMNAVADVLAQLTGLAAGTALPSGFTFPFRLAAASGDATGAADVAAINAAITAASAAGGGTVRGIPGTVYYLNAPFVLKSGVTLDMTGCTINEVAAANCSMLTNAAATTSAAAGTGTVSSGSNVLTTALATATAVAGQSVYVAGGTNGGANVLCGIVGSVNTGAGTLTIVDFYGNALNAAATVTSGVVTLYNRDTSITITGGTWNRGNNGFNASGTPLSCTTNLKRIDGLRVTGAAFTSASDATHRGYHLQYGDCTNFLLSGITATAPRTIYNTDGINGHGPLAFGRIENIFGTCGDDFVSLQCLDSGMTADTTGDISDIEVTGLFPDGNQQAALSLIALNTSCHLRRITVRGVHGSSGYLAVQIGPLSPAAGTSWIDAILLEDINNTAGGGLISVYATNTDSQVVLRNLAWAGNSTTTNGCTLVSVEAGSTLGSLAIHGMAIETTTAQTVALQIFGTVSAVAVHGMRQVNPSIVTASAGMIIVNGGTVSSLSIDGARLMMSSSSAPVIYVNGTVGSVHVRDIYLAGAGALLLATQSGNPAMQVLISNATLNGAGYLIDAESALDISYSSLNLRSLAIGNVIWLGNSTSAVTVRGFGMINPGGTPMFGFGSGAPAPGIVDDTHLLETPVTQPAALFLNGTSDYATAPDAAPLNITGSLTVEMWISPLPSQASFWTPAGKDGQYWFEGSGASAISFQIQSGGVNRSSGTGTITPGRMNHVAGTFDASTGQVFLFINGTFANGSTYAISAVDTSTNPFYLGNRQTFSRFFGGQAADVRIWNGALSSPVINDHYLHPGNLAASAGVALAARWKLDEGTGTTLNDTSGHAGTATLSSGTWIPPCTPYLTQPVLATGASRTVDDVITVLQNIGLVVQ